MGLRINTNVTALNAHMHLSINDSRLSSTIERLSSGLRINKAADDAAGLTISEKLRTQVRGIQRALLNVQDGISLIQTAEGALNEIHAMLQRMRELAIQASNDTLTTTDRLEIQKEIAQLKDDINRISWGTEFNTKRLLDGSGTAHISSSNPKYLDGVVSGEIVSFSDFSIIIVPKEVMTPYGPKQLKGRAQVQKSAIFMRVDGTIASGSTTLQSIANFYDQYGNFILNIPQTLYVQGDNKQGSLIVSKDITLDQLAQRIQAAMTKDQLGNGLNFEGSTAVFYDYGEFNGQITVTSGKNGKVGRVFFTGEESLVKALGFQEVIPAEDPVYSIAVANLNISPSMRRIVSTQIAGHRAAGLIKGVDLVFQPPTNAFARTMSATLGITLSIPVQFTVTDSRTGASAVPVNVTIPAGNFAMYQVASLINSQLVAGGSFARARVNDSYAIEFYTTNTGSSAYVSIANFSGSTALGISNGRYTGTGGEPAVLRGLGVVSTFDFSTNNVGFAIADRHDPTNIINVVLNGNYSAGGVKSIVEAINLQLNNLLIRAYDDNGVIKLQSLETGYYSGFSIADLNLGAPLSTLRLYSGQAIANVNGQPVIQNFAYDQSRTAFGYVIAGTAGTDDLRIVTVDQDGTAVSLTIPAGDAATGNSFRTIASIANLYNNNVNAIGAKLAVEVETATQTLRFFATTLGQNGSITFTDISNPISANTLRSVFNLIPQKYANGIGDYKFKLHIKDAFIQFQIGPNEGHVAKSNIIRTDCRALGIEDLDLTNIPGAQEAIGLIDKAIQRVSSERAKLGAIQNRLEYTHNSLSVALQNMAASESRIRDVDMAREVVELTRFQILQQASNAMLAQANVASQRVLDLLR